MNKFKTFETVSEFLQENRLWTMKSQLKNSDKPLTKSTPIYITGIFGPQGKTTLKNLLKKEGYVNVREMEEVYNDVRNNWSLYCLEEPKEFQIMKIFEDQNKYLIEKYMKNGVVFDFGKETL